MSTLDDGTANPTLSDLRSSRWYTPGSEEIDAAHAAAWERIRELNALGNTDQARAKELLAEIFAPGSAVPGVFAPLHVEFGLNTSFGEHCFLNYNCVILDIAEVTVGANTLFGPGCQLITVEHPVNDAQARADGWERGRPVTIGDNCWFGAGAMVMPGVTVGDNCVVAAGAVVTKDVPDNSLVGGVPAKLIRSLD
ncbi:sugar O-acetyltransferase [Corynebacterium urinipleomorphum]|uniref:sugar O-acetyltransferase n=1 Tax=Corynebacterium urinipleomorphum TaxID=1852380 RepID=UPI000B363C08|nr:sugar O-acetyltransferase [Corynebacterium urinipleomorphum]